MLARKASSSVKNCSCMRHCVQFFFSYMQQCNFNARSFVRNFKLQLDYVSTSMFEKMHAAPALKRCSSLTTFQFHLISKSTKIWLTPLKNVSENSLEMFGNHFQLGSLTKSQSVHSVWKSQKKSHSTLRAKRTTFTK